MSEPFTRLRRELEPRWNKARQSIGHAAQEARKRVTPVVQEARSCLTPVVQCVQREASTVGNRLRGAWQQPRGKIILSASGAVALAVIVLGIVAANYVFGGSDDRVYHGPITAPTLVATNGSTLFTLSQAKTTASFTIHEVLLGKSKTVIGKTQQVAGQILVNAHQPSRSKLSTIRIDVSTLLTDDPRRTHTLHSRILQTYTASNQYATFVPKSYSGLPSSLTIGKLVTFQLHGNLTVHGVTKSEIFAVRLKQDSATQLSGTATTTVNYADFKMAIPKLPFVSDIGKTVVLTLDFTATTK